MISWAQNFEDVVLARAFGAQAEGFYVDAGAGDPELDSVTKHFYDRGWRGVNLEPAAELHARLLAARPRDVNLALALGDRAGRRRLWVTPDTGLSSFDDRRAQLAPARVPVEPREIEVVTLAEVCARHAPATVDLLKVDVEGAERAALAGADWRRWRPRVVVVEAVALELERFLPGATPGTELPLPAPAWAEWEPILLEQGYRCCLFDGLNRFYAREEEPALAARLSVPANVFDGFVPARLARALAELERLRAELDARRGRPDWAR